MTVTPRDRCRERPLNGEGHECKRWVIASNRGGSAVEPLQRVRFGFLAVPQMCGAALPRILPWDASCTKAGHFKQEHLLRRPSYFGIPTKVMNATWAGYFSLGFFGKVNRGGLRQKPRLS